MSERAALTITCQAENETISLSQTVKCYENQMQRDSNLYAAKAKSVGTC